MVHAMKVELLKRNNRRITHSTYLNAIDSKKASLQKYYITPGQEGWAFGVQSSLSCAKMTVMVALANYKEVPACILREVDPFRKENTVTMDVTMVEFAMAQKEHAEKMNEA